MRGYVPVKFIFTNQYNIALWAAFRGCFKAAADCQVRQSMAALTNFFSQLYTYSMFFFYMVLFDVLLLVRFAVCLLVKRIGFVPSDPSEQTLGMFMKALDEARPATLHSGGSLRANLADCSVCLCQFLEGDMVRRLRCNHIFHKDCLDSWLRPPARVSCPLCRSPVVEAVVMDEWEDESWESSGNEETYLSVFGFHAPSVEAYILSVWLQFCHFCFFSLLNMKSKNKSERDYKSNVLAKLFLSLELIIFLISRMALRSTVMFRHLPIKKH